MTYDERIHMMAAVIAAGVCATRTGLPFDAVANEGIAAAAVDIATRIAVVIHDPDEERDLQKKGADA